MSRASITPIEWKGSEDQVDSMNVEAAKLEPVMEDREDGEVSDEFDDVDYNILPRPPMIHEPKPVEQANMAPGAPPAIEYSDEEESQHSADESDSDSDTGGGYRQKKKLSMVSNISATSFRNPNAEGYLPAPISVSSETAGFSVDPQFEQKMKNLQNKRKNNNIWADVWVEQQQEQTLQKFDHIDVGGSAIVVDRGAETYTYTRSNTNPMLKRKHKTKVARKPKTYSLDDDDIGSSGLSDDDFCYLKEADPNGSVKVPNAANIATGFEETKLMNVAAVSEKLKTMSRKQFCFFVAGELKEPKKMLIFRAVEILGRKYCTSLFLKTFKIERLGGLKIKSQARRRTPGGVFFYMLRKDDSMDVEKRNNVFALDKEICSKDRKLLKAKKYRANKLKLEEKLKAEGSSQPIGTNETEKMAEDGEVNSSDDRASSYVDSDDCVDSDGMQIMDDEPDVLEVSIRSNEFDGL